MGEQGGTRLEPVEDRPPVLLMSPLFSVFEQIKASRFRFLEPWESDSPQDMFLASHADSIRVILCSGASPVTADVIRRLPRLECVVATSAGVNHIDLAACKERGIAVCNAGTVFSDDVADFAVGLLLDVLRRISASDRYVRKGLWRGKGEFPLATKCRPAKPWRRHSLELRAAADDVGTTGSGMDVALAEQRSVAEVAKAEVVEAKATARTKVATETVVPVASEETIVVAAHDAGVLATMVLWASAN